MGFFDIINPSGESSKKTSKSISEIEPPRRQKFHKSSTEWVESEWSGGLCDGVGQKRRSDLLVAPGVRIALFYKAFRVVL